MENRPIEDFIRPLGRVRDRAPLVQCITNVVTVNDCANIILAAGGSPSMVHDVREVAEAVAGAQALVCNLGAIEQVEAMIVAGQAAQAHGLPVVFDPVAAGGTQLRRTAAARLLEQVPFAVIRGNASEIRALAGMGATGSGVDVSAADVVTEDSLQQAAAVAGALARRTGSVVVLSGAIDLVTDGGRTAALRNGCATMARITGSGCMLSALLGAFCGASPDEPFEAAVSAVAALGVCGEQAEQRRLRQGTGNATFRNDLIDAVFGLTEQALKEGIRYEIF